MAESLQGAFRLFQVAGINVYVHWSWLLIAVIQIQLGQGRYQNLAWSALEYVTLFGIVLLHEFGHAFACRSVGGQANRIVLWPLGGIAFVSPPPRPGAVLWSIAAGPLVNVILVPITIALFELAEGLQLSADVQRYTFSVAAINLLLLGFNMLPIYPLDGGQILQSLLWFVVGRARSLMIASVLGLVCSAAVILPLLWFGEWWTLVLAVFIGMRSWAGVQQARLLARLDKLPRHAGLACPSCDAAPIQGLAMKCPHCAGVYEVFDFHGVCPACQARAGDVLCINCSRSHPLAQWYPAQ
jgi:Zn-dependent protease